MYVYIYICGEMVDFGESDKMIKISGKVDKSNTYNGFNGNISFFVNRRTLSDFIESSEVLLIKNEILPLNPL